MSAIRVEIEVLGESFNPLESENKDENSALINELLAGIGLAPTYSYKHGKNYRAAKLVKYADDVGDAIDSSYDTIKFVKASDMMDDFADKNAVQEILGRLGHVDGKHNFTISNHVDGTSIHKLFMDNGGLLPEPD